MRILVTGGAGFLGSHLCDKLIADGNFVICMDNFYSGRKKNIRHLLNTKKFDFINHDITEPFDITVDQIYNLASPAAPDDYKRDPEMTLTINTVGIENVLNLAKKLNIPMFQASTVRVYDNANGNPYINGKKLAEKLCIKYPKAKIGRLHSTFGERMSSRDSRVIPSFIRKALKGEDLIVYENKLDKFCCADDMINEIVEFMNSGQFGTKELGHPFEISIFELAKLIVKVANSKSKILCNSLKPDKMLS